MTASSNATRIRSVEAHLYRPPLAEVLSDAKHGDHTHFELVVCTITTEDGATGSGYSYTGGKGGHAILAMLRHDLAPMLIGRDAEAIDAIFDEMQLHIHYVGRGGIASFAISAIDIALWDLRGKRRAEPLWKMAGGASRRARIYRGGIDLNFPIERLAADNRAHLAAGYNAVKIKVGKPDLAEDVARVAAVREAIGPDAVFMVDANYGLDVDQAIAAARAFAPYDLTWFEEPIDPDDFEGYARIAEATGMPLAMGENLHTMAEFDRALNTAKLSFVQPDAGNCGGITGFLRVAAMARRHGIPVCTHGMQELSVSLVAAQPNAGWVESHSFDIETFADRAVELQDGMALAPDSPGTGVTFIEDRLMPHRAD
ncbi:mandelate racemase/muconate lactonizing enzyme family protein [Pelagibacterium sediminicola]|uniref:mandelate racemase/muconate lactonizing enzyme family protein n=1 Tax=Pelagibacterium sediminicola TaxID=2248761 RepID=UPI000E30FB76|nr:mandelate racemase/muconate lactonizing enzyme family protein [Pelagibacterium sediminicola]